MSEVIGKVGEMDGDKSGVRMAVDSTFQDIDHPGEPHDTGLVVQAPFHSVHKTIVGGVHGLVHPDRVGHVDGYGEAQLTACRQQRIHPRVIQVHPPRLHRGVEQPFALIPDFANAGGSCPDAALQLRHRCRAETGLIAAGVIKSAPDFKAVRILGIEGVDGIKGRPRFLGQDYSLFDPHRVHIPHPLVNLIGRLGVGVGMQVDDGVFGFFDGGDGYLVDGLGAIVFKEQAFGRGLRP